MKPNHNLAQTRLRAMSAIWHKLTSSSL